jgi:hypothetical protein
VSEVFFRDERDPVASPGSSSRNFASQEQCRVGRKALWKVWVIRMGEIDKKYDHHFLEAHQDASRCLREHTWVHPECEHANNCAALYLIGIRESRGSIPKGTFKHVSGGRQECFDLGCIFHPKHDTLPIVAEVACYSIPDEHIPVSER